MLYVAAALVLLFYGALLYRVYLTDRRIETTAIGLVLIFGASFFTAFTRTMLVYKPIMVVHIALTLLCWYGVAIYLLYRRFNLWLLLSPAATIAAFFFVAWFFKEA
ncbi:hypothetical protein [Hydrogenimonas cancrithermarum]|uniref:Iron uptake protein n=1 Tax=Hydrogenimonas cancrithermarum TaxID=2993563 RepID=A0ABM8FIZ6_9BACT|nr:hypothetical protein [Hydrogenimonas cancrithermarum]BDY12264.1 hypothetical protein HCR_05760 [Hydrogenimonas cancrithermarum]